MLSVFVLVTSVIRERDVLLDLGWHYRCLYVVRSTAVTNGHHAVAAAETAKKPKQPQDEARLLAQREAYIEAMRRQVDEEREKRRAIIAEVLIST